MCFRRAIVLTAYSFHEIPHGCHNTLIPQIQSHGLSSSAQNPAHYCCIIFLPSFLNISTKLSQKVFFLLKGMRHNSCFFLSSFLLGKFLSGLSTFCAFSPSCLIFPLFSTEICEHLGDYTCSRQLSAAFAFWNVLLSKHCSILFASRGMMH